MKTAITLTTIFKPIVLESYLKNIQNFGHKNVEIIVVGDKKTPLEVGPYCDSLTKDTAIPIRYLDVEWQKEYLKRFVSLDKHLPYHSFSRRNIGDLYAYEEGFDVIIRVDDDNYPTQDDFIRFHQIVTTSQTLPVLSSSNGWYNICEELTDKDNIPFYPRGFPYSKRWKRSDVVVTNKNIPIRLNGGLWLGDPDVDAITRLCKPIDAIRYRETHKGNFTLDLNTSCPINTQNTSYHRSLIPAAFVPPDVGRYDDIWSSYLLKKVMNHLGDFVAFGRPLLKQIRNEHDLWNDLKNEFNGNLYTDHLLTCLDQIQLTKDNYTDCYFELADKLQALTTENKEVFTNVFLGMKVWGESISSLS